MSETPRLLLLEPPYREVRPADGRFGDGAILIADLRDGAAPATARAIAAARAEDPTRPICFVLSDGNRPEPAVLAALGPIEGNLGWLVTADAADPVRPDLVRQALAADA